MEEEVTLQNTVNQPKQVSNKVVVILVVVAVLVSVLGTYFVYSKANQITTTSQTTGNIINNPITSTIGIVGVEIVPKQNQESENK